MMEWLQWFKDVCFYVLEILLFLAGCTILVIHELGRIRRTWKNEL